MYKIDSATLIFNEKANNNDDDSSTGEAKVLLASVYYLSKRLTHREAEREIDHTLGSSAFGVGTGRVSRNVGSIAQFYDCGSVETAAVSDILDAQE